jgi:hypothetical protein
LSFRQDGKNTGAGALDCPGNGFGEPQLGKRLRLLWQTLLWRSERRHLEYCPVLGQGLQFLVGFSPPIMVTR